MTFPDFQFSSFLGQLFFIFNQQLSIRVFGRLVQAPATLQSCSHELCFSATVVATIVKPSTVIIPSLG